MTVSAGTAKAGPYTGNNVTSSFAFSFKVFADADVRVVETLISSGVETDLVLNTDYTIARNVDQDNNPGGSITYLVSSVTAALPSTKKLTIVGDFDYEQPTDIPNGGSFFATVMENALDRIVMFVKQLKEQADRSMRLPVSSSASVEMPMPEANTVVGWNETADALQNYDAAIFASVVAFGTASADLFDGDGTTTTFTLTSNPAALNNLDVSIGGVTQTPGIDYTWSAGTTINFTTAPPVGTDNVLVRYLQGLPQGQGDAAATTYMPAGAGAVETNVQEVLRESISVKGFGAVGDGVTDDTAALNNFFAAVSGKRGILPAGVFKSTSLLQLALSNCTIEGVPGATIITGAFDYATVKLLASSNVSFFGITFETEYVNAVANDSRGVFYSVDADLTDISFRKCKFRAPNANTQGLAIFLNGLAAGTKICSGFEVVDCGFKQVGKIAAVFMNRSTQAGAQKFFTGLTFDRNEGVDLGTIGTHGMLVSLDGTGSGFSICHNRAKNHKSIAYECAGWSDGVIGWNTTRDTVSTPAMLVGVGPGTITGAISDNVTVIGNRSLDATSDASYMVATNSRIEGNSFLVNAVAQAFLLRSSNNIASRNNQYKNINPASAQYALTVDDAYGYGCTGITSEDDIFDNSGGAGNVAALRLTGAGTSGNKFIRPVLIKGAGGVTAREDTSAHDNLLEDATVSQAEIGSLNATAFYSGVDADMTVAMLNYSAGFVRIENPALTVGRNVIMPKIKRAFYVQNTTAFALTFKASTGAGISVASGKFATIFFNGTNYVRLTPDV